MGKPNHYYVCSEGPHLTDENARKWYFTLQDVDNNVIFRSYGLMTFAEAYAAAEAHKLASGNWSLFIGFEIPDLTHVINKKRSAYSEARGML